MDMFIPAALKQITKECNPSTGIGLYVKRQEFDPFQWPSLYTPSFNKSTGYICYTITLDLAQSSYCIRNGLKLISIHVQLFHDTVPEVYIG